MLIGKVWGSTLLRYLLKFMNYIIIIYLSWHLRRRQGLPQRHSSWRLPRYCFSCCLIRISSPGFQVLSKIWVPNVVATGTRPQASFIPGTLAPAERHGVCHLNFGQHFALCCGYLSFQQTIAHRYGHCSCGVALNMSACERYFSRIHATGHLDIPTLYLLFTCLFVCFAGGDTPGVSLRANWFSFLFKSNSCKQSALIIIHFLK